MRSSRFQARDGGNPYVGRGLERKAPGLGFSDIRVEPLYIIDSEREPQRRLELLDYMRDLLLSGAENLIRTGYADAGHGERMLEAFAAARDLEGLRFYYHDTRLICTV